MVTHVCNTSYTWGILCTGVANTITEFVEDNNASLLYIVDLAYQLHFYLHFASDNQLVILCIPSTYLQTSVPANLCKHCSLVL